jgi:hypothetical protein
MNVLEEPGASIFMANITATRQILKFTCLPERKPRGSSSKISVSTFKPTKHQKPKKNLYK